MESRSFNVGFAKYDQANGEELFLSVTPEFELGPGIQRDGISAPRMTDPHCVSYVSHARGLDPIEPSKHTPVSFQQRAGTWTLYNHLKWFHETLGKNGWRVIGVQGHGDLTMNYWHVAYCNEQGFDLAPRFCRLDTREDREANEHFNERTYRCLVKWREDSGHSPRLEFRDIHFWPAPAKPAGVTVRLADEGDLDVTEKVSLAMAGKTIIQNRIELPLDAIIDKYDDVRHIFALPKITATGSLRGQPIENAIFGEYNLFSSLNARRAALHAPVIVSLNPHDSLSFHWETVLAALDRGHFRDTGSPYKIPTLRGEYRQYPGGQRKSSIDIFFPRNVYPFGVIGTPVPSAQEEPNANKVICLASGGLSGRVGNTLEGITRIMYDFLACGEAMVLDEGLDVFQLVNPSNEKGEPKYRNEELLASVAHKTRHLLNEDQGHYEEEFEDVYKTKPTVSLRDIPLNKPILEEVMHASSVNPVINLVPPPEEIFPVTLQRSQIRAVLIFAKKIDSEQKAGQSETTQVN